MMSTVPARKAWFATGERVVLPMFNEVEEMTEAEGVPRAARSSKNETARDILPTAFFPEGGQFRQN